MPQNDTEYLKVFSVILSGVRSTESKDPFFFRRGDEFIGMHECIPYVGNGFIRSVTPRPVKGKGDRFSGG